MKNQSNTIHLEVQIYKAHGEFQKLDPIQLAKESFKRVVARIESKGVKLGKIYDINMEESKYYTNSADERPFPILFIRAKANIVENNE